MHYFIPAFGSLILLGLFSQTLAADHNLDSRQVAVCDPSLPAPTTNPDGSLSTFTIEVDIDPTILGTTFMLGVAPRTSIAYYLGSTLFLSNTGESRFNLMFGTNLYTLSVTNHFCGFNATPESDDYQIYCGVDQTLQEINDPGSEVVGLTWAVVTTCPNGNSQLPVYVLQATLPATFANTAPGQFQVNAGAFREGSILSWCNNPTQCNNDTRLNVTLVVKFTPTIITTATTTAIATVTATATTTATTTFTTTKCSIFGCL